MYQIRKCETYTVCQASEPVNLNPEKFKNLSVPFEGEDEADFLAYISENLYELEEIWDEMDEETQNQLSGLYSPEYKEYFNSTSKFEDSWYESGQVNTEWRKTGDFEIKHSTSYN